MKSKNVSYETYKPNVLHFCELLAEEEGIQLSDTTVRKILYKKNILSPKSHRKTKKRVRKQAKLNPKQPLDNLILPTAEDFLENPKKYILVDPERNLLVNSFKWIPALMPGLEQKPLTYT